MANPARSTPAAGWTAEINPDNVAEMEKGDGQGREYMKALHKMYAWLDATG